MSKKWSYEAEGAPRDIAGELDAPTNVDLNGGEEPDAATVKQMDAARQAAATLRGALVGESFKVEISGSSDGEPTDHYSTGSVTVKVTSKD